MTIPLVTCVSTVLNVHLQLCRCVLIKFRKRVLVACFQAHEALDCGGVTFSFLYLFLKKLLL